MIPTSSSSDSNGCNNISSNCVIWQGPDISCINLCNGDTVSDVVAALAEKLCELTAGISNEPDLTGFDLKCALPSGATPTTLVENLQAIVTYICSLPTDTGTPYTEPNINLCEVLQYADVNGNVVTSLPLSQYAELVGGKVCNIIATITTIQTQLSSIDSRVTVLEGFFPLPTATEVQIIPKCVTSTVGQLTDLSIVVAALETAFCDLQTATGTPTIIGNAVSQQAITNNNNLLSQPSQTYSAQTGWKPSPVNMANSLQNAWIVIKDLYDAVATIQTNCCPGACEDLNFQFSITQQLGPNGIATALVLDFSGSTIPAGFADTGGSTVITVNDQDSTTNPVTTSSNLTSDIQNGANVTINVTSLSAAQTLTVSIPSSFTNATSGAVCEQVVTQTSKGSLPCPSDTAASSITSSGFTVSFTNGLGSSASYQIKLYEIVGGVTQTAVAADSGNITSPGSTVSHAFTGLTANQNYAIRVFVTFQGETKECTDVVGKTEDAAPPCNEGIDIAFLFDYTASMGGVIGTAQTSVASIISDIKTASGHPTYTYRLALATFDEYSGTGTGNTGAASTYSTNSEYTGLPTVQKEINVNTVANRTQYYTCWEDFADNNETAFTQQLNKLHGTVPLGNGMNPPEPGGELLSRVINTGFCGNFRSGVAKIMVIITDAKPGGDDDVADVTDINFFNQLSQQCQNAGIKVIVLGTGVDRSILNGGVNVFPYRDLATQTGGAYNNTFNASNITSAITNACGTT